MNEIRKLKPEEWDESSALSQFAFQYELTEQEKEERRAQSKLDGMWGFFVDGRLAAKLSIHPMHIWVHGELLAMGGIASVATWPEYRRQGMVGQLLTEALRAMKEEGQTVSMLNPFSFAFYRKYGWEACVDRKKYELGIRHLPALPSYPGRIVRMVKEDWPLLQTVYEAYARAYNGMLQRDESWWRHRVLGGGKTQMIAVYFDEKGRADGYVVYTVKEKHFQIREMIFLNEPVRRALWKFIANHDSMIDKVTLTAPVDDRLPYLLDDPRIKQEVSTYFMGRIVDVSGFMERYRFAAGESGKRFTLRVEDAHAPWNDGAFDIAIDSEGKATVRRWEEEAERADGKADKRGEASQGIAKVAGRPEGEEGSLTVSCTIQTLTALLFGYQKAGRLKDLGRLEGSPGAVALLESVVPERTPFLLDSF